MVLDAQLRDGPRADSAEIPRSPADPDPPSPAGDVARLLSQVERGVNGAAEQLLPLVYDELRRRAAQLLAGETPGQTLQATALVHEAYLRLVDVSGTQHWDSRNHFFVAAATTMRRILVENVRHKGRAKCGGGVRRRHFELELLPEPAVDQEVIAVDEALERLSAERPEVARLVELRYFAGLTIEEAAAVLDVSDRTAQRYWAYARARLHHELAAVCHQPTADDLEVSADHGV